MNKLARKICGIARVGMTMGGAFGCSYGALATAADGSVYVARNDLLLFGLLRKMYVCKPAGPALACSELPAPP
jgi:hypothetical protein